MVAGEMFGGSEQWFCQALVCKFDEWFDRHFARIAEGRRMQ